MLLGRETPFFQLLQDFLPGRASPLMSISLSKRRADRRVFFPGRGSSSPLAEPRPEPRGEAPLELMWDRLSGSVESGSCAARFALMTTIKL